MIRFSLRCAHEHYFEGWFSGNDDYEKQQGAGLILCPVCNTSNIGKTLMLPNIAPARSRSLRAAETSAADGEMGDARSGLPVSESEAVNGVQAREGADSGGALRHRPKTREGALQQLLVIREIRAHKLDVLRKLQVLARKMRENAENVGENFTEEARKIHFGEAEKRPIYGKAPAQDVQALLEEGIDVLPLPPLPEDAN